MINKKKFIARFFQHGVFLQRWRFLNGVFPWLDHNPSWFKIVLVLFKNEWPLRAAQDFAYVESPLLLPLKGYANTLKAGFHFNRIVAKDRVLHCVHIICSAGVFTTQWNTLRFATIRLKWKTGLSHGIAHYAAVLRNIYNTLYQYTVYMG